MNKIIIVKKKKMYINQLRNVWESFYLLIIIAIIKILRVFKLSPAMVN